ncbi:hypothetical protein GCM10010123_18020 [Pilimelia anulata]|uniref:Peptidase M43 pregnancy-associated plasma-A domain-containing protein n=1 Tax=Pilimelia anulata TaxID=53371 RepID=A0A8J3F8P7_9ACTN|nr:zinc metalloprotease [Pilimelia anulata]GGJ88803.1 hypothetical protein GCM10010123_18020 [Pilimelia anulata]
MRRHRVTTLFAVLAAAVLATAPLPTAGPAAAVAPLAATATPHPDPCAPGTEQSLNVTTSAAAVMRPFPGEEQGLIPGLAAGLVPAIRHPLGAGLTRLQRLLRERQLARLTRGLTEAMLPRAVTVPVVVHVVSADGTRATGDVTDEMVRRQVEVLNEAYAGKQGGVPTPFSFRLDAINRVVEPRWANITYDSAAEREMKRELRRGGRGTLNVYVGRLATRVAGWSTFPKDGGDAGDGVVLLSETLPGGQVRRYNEGDTAVHEVGHWLNLYHTFEGGCADDGDHVADTPATAVAAVGCPDGQDSCRERPGADPIHNFLDYSQDECMYEFTPGQVLRMRRSWVAYRAD